MPRSLLTTSVASASPSTSSAMISSGRLAFETFSSSGTSLPTLEILSSCTNTSGLASLHSIDSTSVTKCGERYPRSNCMPSTTSVVVSMPLPSSTVITPSRPTWRMAPASVLPTSGSLLALMAAMFRMSSSSLTGVAALPISSVTARTALRMPRASAIASAPAARLR